MGALHEGHLALIRAARKANDKVVVSIFVNPTQFGPREDFARYPRNLRRDRALIETVGADIIFAPQAQAMYPEGWQTRVAVEKLSAVLEGAVRPGHFSGVCTVVMQLLHQVQPDRLYLGQKDYQQACVLQRMVRDLHVPVKVVVCPTVREPSGLALSSRNAYLSAEQRTHAAGIYRALQAVRRQAKAGERDARALQRQLRHELVRIPQARLDYAVIVDAQTLQPTRRLTGKAVALVALGLGATRLIDNILINVS
jgi:pantoate--beta-alanine ligase